MQSWLLPNNLKNVPATVWIVGTSTAVLFLARRRVLNSLVSLFVRISCGKKKGQTYLQGAFSPVKAELFKTGLAVEGQLPSELNGVYIRNGPNPFFKPLASYHWFDGDGMLHACRIKDGKVSYCNRFVDTFRLKQERAAGHPLFHTFGDMQGLRGLLVVLLDGLLTKVGAIKKDQGAGTGNTAIQYAAKKILATHEGDLPYQIRVLCNGLIESTQRLTLEGWKQNFTAHPKLDPQTGEVYFFGYKTSTAPYLTYGRMNPKGEVDRSVPITIPRPVMMHDFAVTQRHAVFMDLPLTLDGQVMVKENKLPVVYRPDLPARLGLLPLDATSEAAIQWFELPSFMVFHTATAFELPNGLVKLYACRFSSIDLNLDGGMSKEEMAYLYEFTMDPKTGTAHSRKISDVPGDFPVVNPARVGLPCQYTWTAIMTTTAGSFNGIGKFQLDAPEGTDACVGRIDYEPGWCAGEAVFVPRFEDPSKCAGEDDGFLLVYLTHPTDPLVSSKLAVYDAASMAPQPLATVALPGRVPLGFHGLFVNETQLQASLVV